MKIINLNALPVDSWVYIEIRKVMYGLKQAGLLANQLLQTRLTPLGYYPARHTPGLWLPKLSQYLSLSLWTILQSNALASKMQSIFGAP
jgi:hypothetical protein